MDGRISLRSKAAERAIWMPQVLSRVLPGAAALRKKTCGGRVRNVARGASGRARETPSCRACARRRYAAIPGCRKFRNGRTKTSETASAAHKIVWCRIRSATAVCPQTRRDSPPLTGAWNAGYSHYDKPGSLSGWFRSLLSPQSIGEGAAVRKSLYSI